MQMSLNYMKKYSTLLIIREMQTEISFSPIRLAKIQKLNNMLC